MEQRKDIMTGIIRILILFIVGSIFLAIAGYILSFVIDIIGRIIVFVLQWAVFGGIAWYGYKYFKKPKPKEKPAEVIPEEAIRLYTSSGQPIVIGNPFRGIFVLGAAGSGKSESIAVPLLSEFIRNGFSGLVYITADNGKEFAKHEDISQKLDINFYFCKPYHSWERGANENTNGLIRQYIPKGTDFSEVTNKRIKWIENNLNNRPRKRLGYLTPNEKFKQIINMNSVAFVT